MALFDSHSRPCLVGKCLVVVVVVPKFGLLFPFLSFFFFFVPGFLSRFFDMFPAEIWKFPNFFFIIFDFTKHIANGE